MIYQLTYISSLARAGDVDLDLDQILSISRRNNGLAEVSGLLVFDGRRFLQALEGERAAVLDTYTRIARDPRHRAIVKLSGRDIAAREFGSWSMGIHCAAAGATGHSDSLIDTIHALTESVPDANTRALFRGFARIARAAA